MLLVFVSIIFLLIYLWHKIQFNYWKSHGIKGPRPELFFGNFRKLLFFQTSIDIFTKNLYNEYKAERVVGFYKGIDYGLLVRDPEIIKQVWIRDFDVFMNRQINVNTDKVMVEQNLFSLQGDAWKVLRNKLSPLFSSGKLKMMFPLIEKVSNDFINYLNRSIDNDIHIFDVKEISSKFTMGTIGSCAFGIEIDTFTQENNPFQLIGDDIFATTKFKRLFHAINAYMPSLAKYIKIQFWLQLDSGKYYAFFRELLQKIIKERELKIKSRNDFMDLIIELKEMKRIEQFKDGNVLHVDITDDLIIAQAFLFFAAGFETSSSTMAFLCYELANNQKLQERVYQEIKTVMEQNDGILTHDLLTKLPLLAACFKETLRKYPVVSTITRVAKRDYVIPDINLKIKKGTQLFISTWGLHNDEKYFKSPETFHPDRFLDDTQKYPQCCYLPFGDGPRNCLGNRFSRVQTTIALASLIGNFKITLSENTPKTIEYELNSVVLMAKGGIRLKISRR